MEREYIAPSLYAMQMRYQQMIAASFKDDLADDDDDLDGGDALVGRNWAENIWDINWSD